MGRLTLLLIVPLLMSPSLTPASFSTRPQCHPCYRTHCNCSGQRLIRVPAIPLTAVTGLDLSFNKLKVITAEDFTPYATLKTLSLKDNSIKVIAEQAFNPLVNLERLDLSFNKLNHLSTTWFERLPSLRYLNLLGNQYRTLGGGLVFQPLKGLGVLHIGGPFLQSVEINDFVGLSGLEELFFYGKELMDYKNGSLSLIGPVSRITVGIDGPFQRNKALVAAILFDISHPNTTLTFTDTSFLTVDQMIPFCIVRDRGIGKVIFRNVKLTDRAFFSFVNCLSHSNVTFLAAIDTTFVLTNSSVNFSRDLVMDHLEEVVVRNIDIPQFYNFPSLPIFFLGHLSILRKVSVIDSMVHTTPCITVVQFSKLEYMDLSGNLFDDRKMSEMMCHGKGVYQALRTINVSRNHLTSLNSQLFTHLAKLENMDMSGNMFYGMPETCDWPPSLRALNLSSSHVTAVTSCLPESLHVLDLTNNDLTTFNIQLPSLTELYISGNKIHSLPDGSLYPVLSSLFIQDSALQSFSNNDLKAYNKLRILKAGADTYVCSCQFVDFMTRDMKRHGATLGDGFESYTCAAPDAVRGRRVVDARPSVFECHMALAVSILCSGILAVFLLTVGLCYKLNAMWYMKMTWAWIRAKRRPVLKKGEICYDAFVSFSEQDAVWVDEHLVPELENSQPALQLCLHKRNFLPGSWIIDNIMDAIEKSHRTLFVLSQHFVRSEWCKYELDYSHFRLFDHNSDTAVLILLEPIAKDTIPKRFCNLRRVMNSRTYLEWPEDDDQRPRFWQSLREALKRPEQFD